MDTQIIRIGSLETNDVVIADDTIQPAHAELEVQSDGLIFPRSGIKSILRMGKSVPAKVALALNDELQIGGISMPINDLIETIRKKYPDAKLADPARVLSPPKNRIDGPVRRSRSKMALAVFAVFLLAGGFAAWRDRKHQMDEMDFLWDSVRLMEARVNDPLNDPSSIKAMESAVEGRAEEAIVMDKYWLGDQPYQLVEYAQKVKKELQAVEGRAAAPRDNPSSPNFPDLFN